ncbi:betaine--homocysteine S-methyltransferase 1-like protein [Lates japonicus]|uniref:Betaine--homocysteine S-methyltransferase 1-like protein n=1 Tax=Lates japonicus TaxID=270547 RepID=A0AAD3N9M8_LATJO|nr:betaine--homocysteine S-methyltransferase 1-like protein [Lates japonicus]
MESKRRKGILERLNAGEVVVGDGGYVLQLERRGYVKAGHWTPEAAVEHPEAVRQLHREFLRAGANVLQTFTFYCSEDKLEISGNVTSITGAQINEAACDLAREVANEGDALVAGGVSQTPCYVESHSETKVKAIFKKQMDDFLKKDIVYSGGDMHGVPPGECAVRLVKAGADIVGINCHLDPLACVRTVKLMKES